VGYSDADRERRIVQLRKGILELAVMGALYEESHYGYSLVRVLTDGSSLAIKEGTMYPILARLHRDGLVRSEWVESDQGPPRKYYELTRSGRELFDSLREEFMRLASLIPRERRPRERAADTEPTGRRLVMRKEDSR
jgi:PadR family transcriptional regulator PadR